MRDAWRDSGDYADPFPVNVDLPRNSWREKSDDGSPSRGSFGVNVGPTCQNGPFPLGFFREAYAGKLILRGEFIMIIAQVRSRLNPRRGEQENFWELERYKILRT